MRGVSGRWGGITRWGLFDAYEEFRERAGELRQQVEALEAERAEIAARLASGETAGPVSYNLVKVILDGFVGQLTAASADHQRNLLKAFVKEITFDGKRDLASIRLHLHEDVGRAQGLRHTPGLEGPVTLSV